MDLRADLKTHGSELNRLLVFAKTFDDYRQRWSHLKNQEDFTEIYALDGYIRNPLDRLYADGAQLALDMKHILTEFNYADLNPTLEDYLEKMESAYPFTQRAKLQEGLDTARNAASNLPRALYSIREMLDMHEDQLRLVDRANETIGKLRRGPKWHDSIEIRIAIWMVVAALLGVIVSLANGGA